MMVPNVTTIQRTRVKPRDAIGVLRVFGMAAVGGSIVVAAAAAFGADIYEYDDAGRLTSLVYSDGSSVSYTYDAAGNITGYEQKKSPFPAGDIDLNNVVDAVDVQLVINGALGFDTGFDCDVDHDGEVGATDVQFVINGALGLNR